MNCFCLRGLRCCKNVSGVSQISDFKYSVKVTTLHANLDCLSLSYRKNNHITWKSIPFLGGLAVLIVKIGQFLTILAPSLWPCFIRRPLWSVTGYNSYQCHVFPSDARQLHPGHHLDNKLLLFGACWVWSCKGKIGEKTIIISWVEFSCASVLSEKFTSSNVSNLGINFGTMYKVQCLNNKKGNRWQFSLVSPPPSPCIFYFICS